MDPFIISYPNTLTEVLCDDIVEYYDELGTDDNFIIPKNNNTWKKIELNIYKQLLMKVNDYKNKFICMDSNQNAFDIIQMLNSDLYIKDFTIQKLKSNNTKYYRENNRHNKLAFLFFLREPEECEEIVFNHLVIKPQKGLLLLFPDSISKCYKIKIKENQYVISGQFSSNVFY
jgi:hypothetical protein